MLCADQTLLKCAVTSLLANALRFIPPSVSPKVTVTPAVVRGVCCIEVTDNGISIRPEDQARLLTPFVRLHSMEEYLGIGLGPATACNAIEPMGGHAGMTSVPEVGSTVWIERSFMEEGEDEESITDRR